MECNKEMKSLKEFCYICMDKFVCLTDEPLFKNFFSFNCITCKKRRSTITETLPKISFKTFGAECTEFEPYCFREEEHEKRLSL